MMSLNRLLIFTLPQLFNKVFLHDGFHIILQKIKMLVAKELCFRYIHTVFPIPELE